MSMKNKHKHPNLAQEALEDELAQSMENVSSTEISMIKQLKGFYEEKCYKTYTREPNQYLEYLLRGAPRDHLLVEDIQEIMQEKEEAVGQEITSEDLSVKPKPPPTKDQIEKIIKRRKMAKIKEETDVLRQQLLQLNKNIEKAKEQEEESNQQPEPPKNLSQAEKQAEVRRFLMEKHKQAAERKKKIQQIEKKLSEKQAEKQQIERKHQQEMTQLRKQEIAERLKRFQEQRAQEKKLRQQHENQFSKVRSQSTSAYMAKDYKKMQEQQIRQKLQTRKQKLDLSPIDASKLEEHSRRYQQYRELEEKKRRERIRLQQSELVGQIKHYSSYQSRNGFQHQEKQTEEDPKEPLRDKLRRVKEYYAFIRDKFRPVVDKQKRKELLNHIEQMQLGARHIKRSKLQNGSILIEQMPKSDPRIKGIQYLQHVRKLASQARSARRSYDSNTPQPEKEAPQKINYLAQLRAKNKHKMEFSEVLERHSYDQKVRMVQHKADMLLQQAKRKQALLKYGKFLTPSQILQQKEQLDEQYLQIINLKLKLIQ